MSATEKIAALQAQVKTFIEEKRQDWYDRIDPFLYYDHTFEYRLIPELWRLAGSVAFFLASALIMTIMNAIADWRHPGAYRLPDLGFHIVPEVDRPNLPNEIMAISVFLTAALILSHPKRIMVLRRLLVIYSIILLLRSVCVISTSLPDPSAQCASTRPLDTASAPPQRHMMPQAASIWRGLKQTLWPFQSSTCGDLIFSGHTVMFVMCSLVWHRYFSRDRSRIPVYLFDLLTLVGLLSIIASRFHYSIDVIIALLVTLAVWKRYHIFIDYTQLYVEEGRLIQVLETGGYTHLLKRKEITPGNSPDR